jgi:hypothetical protein
MRWARRGDRRIELWWAWWPVYCLDVNQMVWLEWVHRVNRYAVADGFNSPIYYASYEEAARLWGAAA